MSKDHWEGFEKEKLFHSVLADRILSEMYAEDGIKLTAKQLKRIIEIIHPSFSEGLFERRFCVRALKYVGPSLHDGELINDGNDFQIGTIYESVDFNGGTYTIKMADALKTIGAAYFEWVD